MNIVRLSFSPFKYVWRGKKKKKSLSWEVGTIFVALLLFHNTLRNTAAIGMAGAVPAVPEVDTEAASMDDSMETDWLHRIDVEERSTREDGGARVDFRSAELSKVNDDGEGSSSGGGKGQDLGMPQAYAQCKASRESELKKRAIETSAVPNFGCEGGEGLKPLGSFSAHPEGMKTCFVGSRVQKGGKLSNQNLATSFDPASLKCVACPTEHDILDKNKPFCICVADQRFISNLSGGGGWTLALRL